MFCPIVSTWKDFNMTKKIHFCLSMISIHLIFTHTAQVMIKCMCLKWSKNSIWCRLLSLKIQLHKKTTYSKDAWLSRTYVSDCWMDFIPSEKSCFSSWNGVMPIFLFSSEAYLTFEPRTCLRVVISPSTYKITIHWHF